MDINWSRNVSFLNKIQNMHRCKFRRFYVHLIKSLLIVVCAQAVFLVFAFSSLAELPSPKNLQLAQSEDPTEQHSHFNSLKKALRSSGHLHFASSMRENSGDGFVVENFIKKKPANYTDYDADMEATIFYTDSGFHENLMFTFPAITTGDIWVQVETYFHNEWATRGGSEVGNAKLWRPRKNTVGGDGRLFDIQIRTRCTSQDNPDSPVGLPTVRCYDCNVKSSNPLEDPRDKKIWQPGGDAKADNRYTPWSSSDLMSPDKGTPFLYMPGRWIRETFHLDLDTNRLKYWMSDEKTDTTLLIADVDNSSLGYPLGQDVTTLGIDGINFNANLSKGNPDPKIRHWHRNLIVGHNLSESEISDLLSGRPTGE